MRNPPFVEMTSRCAVMTKVIVVLVTDSCHRFLEAGQFIPQVLHRMVKNVQLGGLLSNNLPEIKGLETET